MNAFEFYQSKAWPYENISDEFAFAEAYAAAENAALREALARIAALDPSTDSEEGFNEWGEADCFRKAKRIAAAVGTPEQEERSE